MKKKKAKKKEKKGKRDEKKKKTIHTEKMKGYTFKGSFDQELKFVEAEFGYKSIKE